MVAGQKGGGVLQYGTATSPDVRVVARRLKNVFVLEGGWKNGW
jgi:hypothetical protein